MFGLVNARRRRLGDPGPPNAGDVLVSGQWTGPGTVNPQAGEIAGANPGLAQLAQYMGMTTDQTTAWIQSSQAAQSVQASRAVPSSQIAVPAATAAATGSASMPWYGWAAIALVLFGVTRK